jgi:hypothetical protein
LQVQDYIIFTLIFCDFIYYKEKERQWRGLRQVLDTNDPMLTELQPLMEWDDWTKVLKGIINNSDYHSNEVSESDEKKGITFIACNY